MGYMMIKMVKKLTPQGEYYKKVNRKCDNSLDEIKSLILKTNDMELLKVICKASDALKEAKNLTNNWNYMTVEV